MRVLFATNHTYPPQRAGGSESSTHEVCLALTSRGVTVGVLAALSSQGVVGISNRTKRSLFPAWRFPSDTRMGYPVYRGWAPADGVREVVGRFAPTIVVVQAGLPMILVNAFLKMGLPTVLYVHDVEFENLGGTPVEQPLLSCLANSHFTASRLMTAFGIKAHVIPPLVNQDRYRVASNRTTVAFVGLVPKKGVELAFQLAEKRPDIPFEFIESWPLQRAAFLEFKRRAKRLGNVTVRRRVADMRSVYRKARILLAPSVAEEAWGRVCTEAQCSAVPILASKQGGLPESVGAGGVLVDIHAPVTEWLAALSTLWDDAEAYRRLSEAALAHSQRSELQVPFLVDELLSLLACHAGEARNSRLALNPFSYEQ